MSSGSSCAGLTRPVRCSRSMGYNERRPGTRAQVSARLPGIHDRWCAVATTSVSKTFVIETPRPNAARAQAVVIETLSGGLW